jgi:hypothetical protein
MKGINDGEDVDDEEDDEDDDEEEELEESDVKNRRRSINKECNKPQRIPSKSHKWIEMRPKTLGTLKQKILNYLRQCDDALNEMEVEVRSEPPILRLLIRVLISFSLSLSICHVSAFIRRFLSRLFFYFISNIIVCYSTILIDCFSLLPALHSFVYFFVISANTSNDLIVYNATLHSSMIKTLHLSFILL